MMKTILASLLTLGLATSAAAQSVAAQSVVAQPGVIDYRFDEVRRKVTLESQKREVAAAVGTKAQSGDTVQTGWFSYALIATELYRAKFEIFGSTKVSLASSEPGVLLSLERGKLHAIFDKLTGNEPRVVKTPGALLAVRGTQYTIEVDASGNTKLDVHEGIVEVRSPLQREPLLVHAGEFTRFSPQRPPGDKPSPMRGGKQQPNGAKPRGTEGEPRPRGNEPQDGRPSHGAPPSGPPSHGGHGAPPSQPPPSMQPPPSKPPVTQSPGFPVSR